MNQKIDVNHKTTNSIVGWSKCSNKNSMENLAEEFPFLTGLELKELSKAYNVIEFLERKNKTSQEFGDLVNYNEKFFYSRSTDNSIHNFFKVLSYEIIDDEIFVNVDNIKVAPNGTTISKNEKYYYQKFKELNNFEVSTEERYNELKKSLVLTTRISSNLKNYANVVGGEIARQVLGGGTIEGRTMNYIHPLNKGN